MALDPVIQSYLDFLLSQRKAHWDRVVQLREYTNGEQATQMTDDQKILLVGADVNGNPNSDPEFNINVCGIILEALVDRLDIRGFKVTVPDNKALSEQKSQDVWRWWEASGMVEGQANAHFAALRDGDNYPIVDYDPDKQRPFIVNNQTFDGETGVEMAYQDGHPNKPLYAVKRWEMMRPVVGNAGTNRVLRMNVYFDNRIEYYISAGAAAGSRASGWRRLAFGDLDFDGDVMDEEMLNDPYNRPYTATVAWQTVDGTQAGEPLGLNVKHLRPNARGDEYGRSRIADIVPGLVDVICRTGLSIQAATLLNGFKEWIITGFFPTQEADGTSNAIVRLAGGVHYFSPADANVTVTTETDIKQLIAVLDNWIIKVATLTGTPLSLFNVTAQIPAEGTQKQLEQALVIAAEKAQRGLGATWVEAVRQMIIYDAAFSEDSTLTAEQLGQIEDWDIEAIWEPAQSRSEKEEREIAVLDLEQLKVPLETIWQRFFSAEEIEAMKNIGSERQGRLLGELAQRTIDLEAQAAQENARGSNGTDNGANREPATASVG